MQQWDWLLYGTALLGHLALWCAVYNRLHATAWPRWLRKTLEKLIFAVVLFGFLLFGIGMVDRLTDSARPTAFGYSVACVTFLAWTIGLWWKRRKEQKPIDALQSEAREFKDFRSQIPGNPYHGWEARLLGAIPGNQSLSLSVERRSLCLQHWPNSLDGMVIAHLSDFHFNGKIDRKYFERVVDASNDLEPDFVVLTGDLIDRVQCLSWIEPILGGLKARYQKFYVLGNHDLRVKDEHQLRSAIHDAGFERAGGQWQRVQFQQGQFFLAGNELPWYQGADSLNQPADGPSLLLCHSPDQIEHAKRLNVDLMLTGHCHGGQIRIPWIGPIITPSHYGVRFASGTFQMAPTIMHVSRGISGDDPIRLNCPPELNLLTIRASNAPEGDRKE